MLHLPVDLGDFQSSLEFFSRCSIFENMCVVNCGWLGWLAILDSREVQFSKMNVLHILLIWVTCHSLANIFSRGTIQNIYVVIAGWLGWLAISRKIISRKSQFWKYMCGQSWLTWLTCRFSSTNSKNIWFSKICMLQLLVDLGDFQSSLEIFSRCSIFEICVA